MTNEKPRVDGLTFGQVLKHTAEHFGGRDAVVFPQLDLRWNYTEFYDRVDETARALIGIGIEHGDHVGIWATNWPEWILLQFATARIGAVLVNVNPAYRTHELAYILRQADIRVLFITDEHKTSNYIELISGVVPEVTQGAFGDPIQSKDFPKLQHVVSIKKDCPLPRVPSWEPFIALGAGVAEHAIDEREHEVQPNDPVNIQYTSGTTGDPKGAMLSHRNLLMNAWYVGQRQRMSEQDRLCIPVPFYHCFGCVMGTLMCAEYGAAMVVPAESFDPEATMDAVDIERCTALYGVPTMFSAQVKHPDFTKHSFETLRTGIMAGSPCPIELMKQVTSKMHLTEMTIAYGQTEASPVVTQSETTDSLEDRVGTVGSPIPGVEVRLVDPETGGDVADGEQGELWARGHGVMLGYYNMPEETKAAIDSDGWLHSGDLATRTPNGMYKITGRIKDMIIRGGENIYPREIEEFLLTHPEVREVQVVGLPDEKFGEQVSAWIVPEPEGKVTEDVIRKFCKDRIAHYKIPHYIVFVAEFPLTVTGKVQKFKLRDMGIEQFGLQAAASAEMA